ncbi:MAG: helix-turn-helix domain-containing protein [Oscillospiraceae bacterium]|nr:helix-turn-helix domain-containing protein [Oscillospiraceae bacterium]
MAEKRVPIEKKQEIVRQYYEGKSVEQLSGEYSCSKSSVYRWIREYPWECAREAAVPQNERDEFFDEAYTPADLGWMFAMMGMVQDANKLVRAEAPPWLVS